jgi:cytoskeletal protein CcmA (bactofilin family)
MAAMKEVSSTIKSLLNVAVVATKIASGGITSVIGDLFVFGTDGLMVRDTLMFANKFWAISMGRVNLDFAEGLRSGGEVQIVGWDGVKVLSIDSASTEINSVGDVKVGSLAATDSVTIKGQNIYGLIGTSSAMPDAVTVQATGNIGATINARTSIAAQALGNLSGVLTATHDPQQSYIEAAVSGDVTGVLHAGGSVGLQTWGNLIGTITVDTGSVIATVGQKSSGTISAGGLVEEVVWGDVTSTITTQQGQGYVDLMAAGTFNGTINSSGDANLEVWGDMTGTVNAGQNSTTGGHASTAALTVHGNATGRITSSHNVSLDGFGSVSSPIKANAGRADVNAYTSLTNNTIQAATGASVSSWGTIRNVNVDTTNPKFSLPFTH